jgi:hypothetical protein
MRAGFYLALTLPEESVGMFFFSRNVRQELDLGAIVALPPQ